jgi:DNA-3-methyladenine glycosylase I
MTEKKRCFGGSKPFYADYHDNEWGVPLHDERRLFEMLILEGQQAGLSWEIILKRREGYRKAFHNFDPSLVASMSDEELEELLHNTEIIRNRLKIFAARRNALCYLDIQREFGSFDRYLWNFVSNKPIVNRWTQFKDVPCSSPLSDLISKDLKKRGMTFVGTKIIYSYLQAVGVINDHTLDCWCYGRS